MAMNQPILDRPMFQGAAPTVAPMGSPMGGVGSITTPDQNATALRNMFAPQPSAQPAPQGYRRGGEIINGVAHFAEGGLNKSGPPGPGDMPVFQPGGSDLNDPLSVPPVTGEPPAPTPPRYVPKTPIMRSLYGAVEATPERQAVSEQGQQAAREAEARAKAISENRVPTIFEEVTDQDRAAAKAKQQLAVEEALRRASQETIAAPPAAGIPSLVPSDTTIKSMQDTYSNPNPANLPPPLMGGTPLASPVAPPASPPPALPPVPDGTELQLQSIKARREQSEKDREQNKWMGILSAGLGMMASKDPRGIVGIGTGAQQGLATYQAAEKGRREDEATRRHEDIQSQQLRQQKQISDAQLAQQKTLTMAQIEKDPDNVRLFRALGGGDLQKGLNMYQADGKLQAAKAITDNMMSSAAARAEAEAYIRSALQRSGTAASGSAPGAPPPGSPVVSASDFVAGKK